jgi:DNA-binding MarR family transcriptional regulator
MPTVIDLKESPGILRQSFYMYADQWQFLREYAHKYNMSMSEVIRELIDTLDMNSPAITGRVRQIHYKKAKL